MKCTLVKPYDQASGKTAAMDGTVLYCDKKGRQLSRDWVIPNNPESSLQTSVRNAFITAQAAWNGLDANQIAAWKVFSDAQTKTDVFGRPYDSTPRGEFIGINVLRILDGQAVTETAPTHAVLGGISDISELELSGTSLSFNVTHSLAGGTLSLVELCLVPTYPGRKARTNDLRMASDTVTQAIVATPTTGGAITIANSNVVPAATTWACISVTTLTSGYEKTGYFAKYIEMQVV